MTISVAALADRYVATFATKDLARVSALHAPDGTFWLHTGEDQVTGPDAISERFERVFQLWPDLRFEVHRTLVGEDFWVLDWSILVPAGGGQPDVKIDCLDVVTIDERGLVARKDTYLDGAQLTAVLAQGAG